MTEEKIGELAIESFKARKEYEQARKDRAEARKEHPCDGEEEHDECWGHYRWPVESWCENCQYVQKYYLAMKEALNKSNSAKQKLTNAIKQAMK